MHSGASQQNDGAFPDKNNDFGDIVETHSGASLQTQNAFTPPPPQPAP